MTVERSLRMIAGGFVAASVLLGIYVNANFLWFTLFVGVNLLQSAFTNWCPMMTRLRRAGVRRYALRHFECPGLPPPIHPVGRRDGGCCTVPLGQGENRCTCG